MTKVFKFFALAMAFVVAQPGSAVAQQPAPKPQATPAAAPAAAPAATVRPVPVPAPAPPITPAAAAPAAAAPAPNPADQGYVLGPDDVIDVKVLGQPEFQAGGRIEANGTINIQFIGTTAVNGETPLTLSRVIEEKLRAGGYYMKPIVTVTVVSFSSRYVTVLGEVGAPGLVPINRSYRLSEIIARVNGIRGSGADFVILRRSTGQELRLDFEKMAVGTGDEDPVVYAGDKIYVPAAEIFYIQGQVGAPGTFPIKANLTLRKALARAGGLTPLGSAKRIEVFRNGKSIKLQLEDKVMPDDVIVAGERPF